MDDELDKLIKLRNKLRRLSSQWKKIHTEYPETNGDIHGLQGKGSCFGRYDAYRGSANLLDKLIDQLKAGN